MSLSIQEILKKNDHRTWENPSKNYQYYQEWNDALFFHWKVDVETLRKFVPEKLELDLLNGEAWISLVAFTMEKIRPIGLPAVSFISNFDEINLRTYVVKDGKPGVYFLNIEAGKLWSAKIAKALSGLPYEFARMRRNRTNAFQSIFDKKRFSFSTRYRIGKLIEEKSEIDLFLTERYCLYTEEKNQIYRFEIHHIPWEINQLWVSELETNYRLDTIDLNRIPQKMHYSKGVQVVAWGKVKV